MSNGWKQGKTLSNGWTIHTNWMHHTKEYRSPCGDFKVDKLRNGAWRLLKKSTYPDGSPCWKRIYTTTRPSACFNHAEKMKEEIE